MSTWANRVKEDLSNTPTRELKQVGGSLPNINTYYQYSAPKPTAPPSAKQLEKGVAIVGTYEGSFATKKFGTTFHKVNTANGLVAIQGSGQLNNLMKKVAQGAEVKITYQGSEVIKKGNFAGKSAHSFQVAASDLIA